MDTQTKAVTLVVNTSVLEESIALFEWRKP